MTLLQELATDAMLMADVWNKKQPLPDELTRDRVAYRLMFILTSLRMLGENWLTSWSPGDEESCLLLQAACREVRKHANLPARLLAIPVDRHDWSPEEEASCQHVMQDIVLLHSAMFGMATLASNIRDISDKERIEKLLAQTKEFVDGMLTEMNAPARKLRETLLRRVRRSM